MAYQIVDNGASIWIASDGRLKLVMKTAIVDVRVVRQNILKLTTDAPLQSVYLPYAEVTSPQYDSPIGLRDAINSMISSCVCCHCGATQPVP